MATTGKGKKASTTEKKTTKKQSIKEQIENIEKALEQVEGKDVTELLPEEVKAEMAEEPIELNFEEPKDIDFDGEVKKIFETAEPSEEVKKQVEEFEEGKKAFDEKMAKEPENAEEVVKAEINRVEKLIKKAEALKTNIQKQRPGNEGFTNWWNGSSGIY